MAAMNDVRISFQGNINPDDPTGIKIYLQATKGIDKETDKLDVSVSNVKDIVDNFLSLANKYGLGFLVFTVGLSAGTMNIFRVV